MEKKIKTQYVITRYEDESITVQPTDVEMIEKLEGSGIFADIENVAKRVSEERIARTAAQLATQVVVDYLRTDVETQMAQEEQATIEIDTPVAE